MRLDAHEKTGNEALESSTKNANSQMRVVTLSSDLEVPPVRADTADTAKIPVRDVRGSAADRSQSEPRMRVAVASTNLTVRLNFLMTSSSRGRTSWTICCHPDSELLHVHFRSSSTYYK